MVARPTRKKMYRTMQGRMVDIDQLRAANESVQAVGNMNVNARGDVLGANGQVVTPKSQVIKKYYEQPKGKASEGPSTITKTPAPQPKAVETKAVETKAVETKAVAPKKVATPKKTVAPKKGIDEALDGLE
jgi:hypothetical protein|tara:strand:- start:111 stop:503 length:393 start_codon:yes stop_codon:yes gene_type:complete